MAKKKEQDLTDILAETLNKQSKSQQVAFFLDSDGNVPTNVPDWVSFGNAILDVAVSNRAYGGAPVGRIIEITGLEQCVTEDTLIDVIIETNQVVTIPISDIPSLLRAGKSVKVKNKNNEFVPIVDYFDKGILPTFLVELDNGNKIKTSAKHRFFTSRGWLSTDLLKPTKTKIYGDDGKYHNVKTVSYIGEHRIVDIKVDSDEHSYFGNGFLNHNSGKSLVAAHLLAETQKKGGVAVLIDTENAVSTDFLRAIGVDISKLLYIAADSVEQCFEFTETIIEKVREADRDRLVTIVVDSVAAASTKTEIASEHGKDGYATDKAIIISKAMRKITNLIGRQKVLIVYTNQLRVKMNALFGDPWTTSGGKAIAFHSSVRLRLKNMGQIKVGPEGAKTIIGIKVRCQVVKNRIGPPLRSVDMEIYFDRGIDNYGSWLKVMKENKLLKQGGAWYTYVDTETGEEHKFQSKDFIKLLKSNDGLEDQIYNHICDATIRKYVSAATDVVIDPDDIEIDTKGAGVDD